MINLGSLGKIEGLNLKLDCNFDELGSLDVNELTLAFKREENDIEANITLSNIIFKQIGEDCSNFILNGCIKGNSFVVLGNKRIEIINADNVNIKMYNNDLSIVFPTPIECRYNNLNIKLGSFEIQ